MILDIIQTNILDSTADALLLPIDGDAPGMEGAIARQFDLRFPDAELLEELKELKYPLPAGSAEEVELEEGSPFEFAIAMSMLNHKTPTSDKEKENNIIGAFTAALRLCNLLEVKHAATPVLVGGWRIKPDTAFSLMLRVLGDYQKPYPEKVTICSLDDVSHFRAVAQSMAFKPNTGTE